jgi:hypothetical protein
MNNCRGRGSPTRSWAGVEPNQSLETQGISTLGSRSTDTNKIVPRINQHRDL